VAPFAGPIQARRRVYLYRTGATAVLGREDGPDDKDAKRQLKWFKWASGSG